MQRLQQGFKRITEKSNGAGQMGRIAIWLPPLFWIVMFFVAPFLIVLKISFAESIFAAPPYSVLMTWVDEMVISIKLNLENYFILIDDNVYLSSYFRSLSLAAVSAFLCLLVGYPMAYGISRASSKWRSIFLLMIILPFWTSFLIRVYAWTNLLSPKGIINQLLLNIGMIQEPLPLIYNNFSVCLGIVYSYLPFMILPLYASLEKIDRQYMEAAADLGARPFRTFLKITLPLSLPGIFAGSMLVFIPAVGEFVIPELLGGPENLMIGKVLWAEFFDNQDWPVASAIAVALLILLVLPMVLLQRLKMLAESK